MICNGSPPGVGPNRSPGVQARSPFRLTPKAQVGALDLLVGSLALKVDKLWGGNRLDVHTETAVMGVRGNRFAVETEVDGSVLVLGARYLRSEARVEKLAGLWDRRAQEEKAGRQGGGVLEKNLDAEASSALTEVRRSAPWAAFVKGWRALAPSLERSMAATRFKVKLFALRHQGRLDRPRTETLPVLSGGRTGASKP